MFPLLQCHACKLAKLSACIDKWMTTINKIYIFYILHLHYCVNCVYFMTHSRVNLFFKAISQCVGCVFNSNFKKRSF